MYALVRILAYNGRGSGFDPRTAQTFVCMNMSVCIGSGCFLGIKAIQVFWIRQSCVSRMRGSMAPRSVRSACDRGS
jgi:hypothetical protein